MLTQDNNESEELSDVQQEGSFAMIELSPRHDIIYKLFYLAVHSAT